MKMLLLSKKMILLIVISIICLVGIEMFLRFYFGFCDAVLIKEDPDYEYTAIPNQKRFRFRKNIYYNAQSMRSNEIDDISIKILGFGDSVLNGGVLTDQDSLATTILSVCLSERYNANIQFLNISAGSWGPDNCYAFLKKHGDFNAKYIFLFASSHDAHDNMDFERIVDVQKCYPSNQYRLALFELLDRYLLPRIMVIFENSTAEKKTGLNKKQCRLNFNSGFKSFKCYSIENGIPLTIYLHAERAEVEAGDYNKYGQKIIQFAQNNNIRIIKDLENGLKATDFRDYIHLNNQGQRKLSEIILNAGIGSLDGILKANNFNDAI